MSIRLSRDDMSTGRQKLPRSSRSRNKLAIVLCQCGLDLHEALEQRDGYNIVKQRCNTTWHDTAQRNAKRKRNQVKQCMCGYACYNDAWREDFLWACCAIFEPVAIQYYKNYQKLAHVQYQWVRQKLGPLICQLISSILENLSWAIASIKCKSYICFRFCVTLRYYF